MSDETPQPTVTASPEQPPQPAPTPDPAPAEPTPQTFDAAYVEKLRKEAAKYRMDAKANAEAAKRLADIEEANKTAEQKQAEKLAQLQAENAQLQADMIRAQVAASKGVPADLLTGTTEEELNAAADRLLAFRGETATPPAPDFGAGDRGDAPSKPKQLTRADMARMTADQIVAADDAGQFDDLKAGRR